MFADEKIPFSEIKLNIFKLLNEKLSINSFANHYNIKRLVSEFRKYGRPIELRKTPSNINEILKDEIWHATPPDNIKIIQELSPDLPDLEVDGARFPESIKELLGNAIRVTNESKGTGNIYVSTSLLYNEKGKAEAVLIKVEDDGPGFPPKLPVFEPFHSTDPTRTGLELATVRENLEAHGGAIRLVKKSGMGACFEMRLPIPGGTK